MNTDAILAMLKERNAAVDKESCPRTLTEDEMVEHNLRRVYGQAILMQEKFFKAAAKIEMYQRRARSLAAIHAMNINPVDPRVRP